MFCQTKCKKNIFIYPKYKQKSKMERKTKPKNPSKKIDIRKLSPASVLCPICRTILVEPVSLPCEHAFCKVCFEGSMQNTNLVCPLCRLRVASWLRKSGKDGNLVNKAFWQAIQDQFPTEVQNKLAGIDNEIEEDKPRIIVASPGEIRKEYEKERQILLEEQRKIREDEEKASATLIQKLQEEEEFKVQVEEEKIKSDMLLARKLSVELNSPSTSKITPRKRKGPDLGPMDRYLLANQIPSPKHKPVIKKPIESNKIIILNPKKRTQTSTVTSDRTCKRQKRDTISPVLSKNYFGKQYTCQVFSVEQNPVRTSLSTNIFADLDVKGILGNLGQKPTKLIEQERRKDVCLSGYRSTESNSDVIDQECKFYFKPIEVHRKHHVGGRIPVKVPGVKGQSNRNPTVLRPRTKKMASLGSTASAFVKFSRMSLPHSYAGSNTLIEAEDDVTINVPYINKDTTPKKALPYGELNKTSSRLVVKSPFYGFDTLQIAESIKTREVMDKIIKNLRSVPFTTTVSSLKVGQIIEKQIVELQRSIERREVRKKRENRDINRNLSEVDCGTFGNKQNADEKIPVSYNRNSIDVNSGNLKDPTRQSLKLNGLNKNVASPDLLGDHLITLNQVGVGQNGTKIDQLLNSNSVEILVNKSKPTMLQNCYQVQSNITTENLNNKIIKGNQDLVEQKSNRDMLSKDPLDVDFDTILSGNSLLLETSEDLTSTKGPKSELKIGTDVFDSSSEDEDFSKLIDSICNSSEDSQNSGFTSLTDNGGQVVKNGSKLRDNRKITDNISKVKLSPLKGKKVFNSPRKKKVNSTTAECYDESQKKTQEELDFALAQKLQAEFDLLQVASRTRRGTKRQITLDELLTA
ncbi:uncharacterized protein LOC126745376 isoform X2 [Anthonomus grandis grandis]|uniref:uncharacterized protein LOC126745376 isoform X2 n=1 Tax=Anthonomus grandis grandis TaxID=2921223 RepID=UPI0021651F13|nr:uncharacterized protein LOC126745376 isoform X2 [Anthonomus grandis grandis]